MFSGFIDDFKTRLDLTLKAVVAGAIAAFAAVTAFWCAIVVLFLYVMQNFGTLEAWAAVGGVFLLIAVGAAIPLLRTARRQREIKHKEILRKAAEEKKEREKDWWQDPAMVLAGVQLARSLGIKRMLPVLTVVAVAGGYLFSRFTAENDATPTGEPAE